MLPLFILFTLIPVIELYLLIIIGYQIGFVQTCFIIFITGALGAFFVRTGSIGLISKINEDVQRGIVPGKEITNGLLLLVGAILLITPGVITDILGLMLVLPGSRDIIRILLMKKFKSQIHINHSRTDFRHTNNINGNIIDGEAKIKE